MEAGCQVVVKMSEGVCGRKRMKVSAKMTCYLHHQIVPRDCKQTKITRVSFS